MNNTFHYKGYQGSAYYDVGHEEWYGHVTLMKDLITYEARTKAKLFDEFVNVVESYLEFCKKVKKKPEHI